MYRAKRNLGFFLYQLFLSANCQIKCNTFENKLHMVFVTKVVSRTKLQFMEFPLDVILQGIRNVFPFLEIHSQKTARVFLEYKFWCKTAMIRLPNAYVAYKIPGAVYKMFLNRREGTE